MLPSTITRQFTAVIASVCDEARSESLRRACDSVRAMAGEFDYSILVVANGARVNEQVLDWLAARDDVQVVRLRTGSYPLARRVGAELARCDFLGFLDDDDEFVPGTLAPKLAYFEEHPEVDVLVTDGLRISGPETSRIFPAPQERSADTIETLMRAGWGAGALTLRMPKVSLAAFDAEFRYLEWTLTTLELARRYTFGYLDMPTYRYYDDTPGSLSKSPGYRVAAPELWRRLLVTYAGTVQEPIIRRRYGWECHNAAEEYARRGEMGYAWRLHLESLKSPGGLSFIPMSARLMLAALLGTFISEDSPASKGALEAQKRPSVGPAS